MPKVEVFKNITEFMICSKCKNSEGIASGKNEHAGSLGDKQIKIMTVT